MPLENALIALFGEQYRTMMIGHDKWQQISHRINEIILKLLQLLSSISPWLSLWNKLHGLNVCYIRW